MRNGVGNRNNEDRFEDPRLEWTRHVPNTLYVFSLIDPRTKKTLIKFGRTQVRRPHVRACVHESEHERERQRDLIRVCAAQHSDAWKRYPTKERNNYKMELLLSLRGKLEVTTKIENWWKSQAEENNYFVRCVTRARHHRRARVEAREVAPYLC
jgi:hypothetical protein